MSNEYQKMLAGVRVEDLHRRKDCVKVELTLDTFAHAKLIEALREQMHLNILDDMGCSDEE